MRWERHFVVLFLRRPAWLYRLNWLENFPSQAKREGTKRQPAIKANAFTTKSRLKNAEVSKPPWNVEILVGVCLCVHRSILNRTTLVPISGCKSASCRGFQGESSREDKIQEVLRKRRLSDRSGARYQGQQNRMESWNRKAWLPPLSSSVLRGTLGNHASIWILRQAGSPWYAWAWW